MFLKNRNIISKMNRSKVTDYAALNINVLLIKVSITNGRKLILHYIGVLPFFHGGHLENHPKWRVGSKISSINILILNQRGPMNNIIPLPEGP